MKSEESVTDFFGSTMLISNQMRINKEEMQDVTIVEKVLRSVLPKFNFVVCLLKSKDIDILSIDELQSYLLVHKKKINQQEQEVQVFKASTTGCHSVLKGEKNKQRQLEKMVIVNSTSQLATNNNQ